MDSPRRDVTTLLRALRDPNAEEAGIRERLYSSVYDELGRVAGALMFREKPGHTLEPLALVHEVYLKLVDQGHVDWKDRAHFFGVATRAMRQILVDHSRRRGAAKRGGGWTRVTLTNLAVGSVDATAEVLALDQLISKLAGQSERMARVVELHVFGAMTHEDIAEVLGVSVRTVAEDWSVARRWLARETAQGDIE